MGGSLRFCALALVGVVGCGAELTQQAHAYSASEQVGCSTDAIVVVDQVDGSWLASCGGGPRFRCAEQDGTTVCNPQVEEHRSATSAAVPAPAATPAPTIAAAPWAASVAAISPGRTSDGSDQTIVRHRSLPAAARNRASVELRCPAAEIVITPLWSQVAGDVVTYRVEACGHQSIYTCSIGPRSESNWADDAYCVHDRVGE